MEINNFSNKNLNCIVIHGCPPNKEERINFKTRTYDKHWIQWLKKELSLKGIKLEIPIMLHPWKPDYDAFRKEFEKYSVSKDTVLIGHSCGCAFLVRWLGESKKNIKKLILVAPWKIPDKDNKLESAFYNYPIDRTIKSRVKKIVMFTSDNEADNGRKSLKIFYNALGGEVIELKGRGHYILGHMGTVKFPELLKEIINVARPTCAGRPC